MSDKSNRGIGGVTQPTCGGGTAIQLSSVIPSGPVGANAVPEYFARILKNKDRIIREQAKRIEALEREAERLRVTRETLSSQVAILSYQLELSSRAGVQTSQVSQPLGLLGTDVDSEGKSSVNRDTSDQHCAAVFSEDDPSAATFNCDNIVERSFDTVVGVSNSTTLTNDSGCNGSTVGGDVVEELSRKYGGYLRARRAATVIQQTFRQYAMSRSFAKLRLEAGESRRSRRFGRRRNVTGKSDGEKQQESSQESPVSSVSVDSRRANDAVAGRTPSSMAMQINDALNTAAAILMQQTSSPRDNDDVVGGDIYDGRLHGGECSSSRSLSPLPPPMNPVATAGGGDLPSVCFETMLDDDDVGSVYYGMAASKASTMFPLHSNIGRSPYVVGIPKDSAGVRKFFDFPHLPGLTNVSNSNLQVVSAAATGSAVRHQQQSSCGAHHNPLTSSLSCTHRKNVCLVSGDGPNTGSEALNHCAVSTPCNLSAVPASCFNVQSESSPIWKRKSSSMESCDGNVVCGVNGDDDHRRRDRPWSDLYPGSTTSSEDAASIGSGSNNEVPLPPSHNHHHFAYYRPGLECLGFDVRVSSAGSNGSTVPPTNAVAHNSAADRQRKRLYRIGLNLFNKHPEDGIRYLISQRFVDNRPAAVARFLITRKGLSRQKIGDYLGNLQQRFNMDVLGCFAEEIDLTGLQVDEALRNFQSYFRMPGEAQKIERLMEAFASCYCECNADLVRRFRRPDTVFLLAFAIIMLNTDLHNKNIKPERKMKLEDFIRNLRGIDNGDDIDRDLLVGIYERTSAMPFKPAADHVTQVMKVEQMIIGKKPVLALPYRRLVCYCRLYEVLDPNKRDRSTGQHQREVFLFNDMLMVTKSVNKKKENVMYTFRQAISLYRMVVYVFETPHYQFGIQLTTDGGAVILGTFCARNERDRAKFVEDLKEAILEMNDMVTLELRGFQDPAAVNYDDCSENYRSGEFDARLTCNRLSAPECGGDGDMPLRKALTSSSLVDVSEGDHSGSSASLDSGLPSTSSGSTASSQEMGHGLPQHHAKSLTPQPQLLSTGPKFNLFAKKVRTTNKLSPNGSAMVEF